MNERLKSICPNLYVENSRIAIYEKERVITYGELRIGIDNLSSNLLKLGGSQGNRIGLCFENTAAFVYGFMAILNAKCIPVLISTGLPAEKAAYILEDSGAIGMMGDSRTICKIQSYPHQVRFVFLEGECDASTQSQIAVYSFEDGMNSSDLFIKDYNDNTWNYEELISGMLDINSIIYTSGTTGKPKGVMLTETNLLMATSAIENHLDLTTSDTCLVAMSFAHCAGLLHLLAHLQVGAKVVTGENPTLIGPFLAAIRKHGVSILPGVPSFFALLLKLSKRKIAPYTKDIRAVESSSAMINGPLIKEIYSLFPSASLFNTYGLTEAPRATYMEVNTTNPERTLSLGLPTAGVTIQIINQRHQVCEPYEEGEIVIKGPNLAMGYWNNPANTDNVFNLNGFRTGDIGYIDDKGYLFLKGRKDDMIKVNAEAIYPQEIEEVVASYPGINEVLAYAVEDKMRDLTIHVKAVCNNKNLEENDIIDYCRDKLEKYKIPSKIIFCDQIELEESGKPKRNKILL